MTSANRYRALAADCVALAQTAADPEDKARLIDMAQAWRDLADRAEARDQTENDDS